MTLVVVLFAIMSQIIHDIFLLGALTLFSWTVLEWIAVALLERFNGKDA